MICPHCNKHFVRRGQSLSDGQIADARRFWESGMTMKEVGDLYGVSASTISKRIFSEKESRFYIKSERWEKLRQKKKEKNK